MQDPPILIDGASKIRSAGSPQQQQEQPDDDQTIVAVFPPLVLEDTIHSQEHTFTGQSEPISPLNPVMNQEPNRVYRKSQFSPSKVDDESDLTSKLYIIKQNTQKEANKKHKNHHHHNGMTKSLDFVTDGSPVGRLNQSYQATSSFF